MAALFEKLSVCTLEDLILFYPRSYDCYEKPISISQATEGQVCAVKGRLIGSAQAGGNKSLSVVTIQLADDSGKIKAIWFRQPYLRGVLKAGMTVILRGSIVRRKDSLWLEQPQIFRKEEEYLEKLHRMQPLYRRVKGLSNACIEKAVKQALQDLKGELLENLPEVLCSRYQLLQHTEALWEIHFPRDRQAYEQARKRLVFEEFFFFLLGIRKLRKERSDSRNSCLVTSTKQAKQLLRKLPFSLTKEQEKVWKEILGDLTKERKMSRLVQGDVGSGKTILAFLALLSIVENGYQGALMAPTETLARQHYRTLCSYLQEYGLAGDPILLLGSMTAKEKRESYEKIATGEADMIIGTHALIQEKVLYHRLGLVITDEQHRFGVGQRGLLAKKGKEEESPHVLVMSATPIPRTLALILYGDLEVSTIRELPAHRLPIKNCVVDQKRRPAVYQFLRKEVLQEGHQCYVICPFVEESEAMEGENVLDYTRSLQTLLGSEIQVSCLHGRMKTKDKTEVMEEFAKGKSQVLVSTTVIEVGIDVPNATVMLIENAERFGLAQLHQLRGRVGRGTAQSYCIFMTASEREETKQRLNILLQSNDGFTIAEEDLKMRGPGDLYGIRQSGLMNFQLGDIYQDHQLLLQATEAVNVYEKKMSEYETNTSVKNEYLHIL